MKFFRFFKAFRDQEDGAVTVDWVVLTAALVGISIAVLGTVSIGVNDLSTDVSTELGKVMGKRPRVGSV